MLKTTNLGLELTDDDSTEFKNWREKINGSGSGENKSNMQLIDEFAGEVKTQLENVTGIASEISQTAHTDNFPITIKQGTTIYFTTNYSSNILYTMQIYNSENGENKFPALKMEYGGGYTFYYSGSSYFEITKYWNDDFADSFENDYIAWDKTSQTLTYKGIETSIFDSCTRDMWDSQVNDKIVIKNITKFGELEQQVGNIDAVLTAILGV